jgi:hypothetical protein
MNVLGNFCVPPSVTEVTSNLKRVKPPEVHFAFTSIHPLMQSQKMLIVGRLEMERSLALFDSGDQLQRSNLPAGILGEKQGPMHAIVSCTDIKAGVTFFNVSHILVFPNNKLTE